MSGDGGNPPSLRDLLGAYEKSGLGIHNGGHILLAAAGYKASQHDYERVENTFHELPRI
jgi:hypothetical protein